MESSTTMVKTSLFQTTTAGSLTTAGQQSTGKDVTTGLSSIPTSAENLQSTSLSSKHAPPPTTTTRTATDTSFSRAVVTDSGRPATTKTETISTATEREPTTKNPDATQFPDSGSTTPPPSTCRDIVVNGKSCKDFISRNGSHHCYNYRHRCCVTCSRLANTTNKGTVFTRVSQGQFYFTFSSEEGVRLLHRYKFTSFNWILASEKGDKYWGSSFPWVLLTTE